MEKWMWDVKWSNRFYTTPHDVLIDLDEYNFKVNDILCLICVDFTIFNWFLQMYNVQNSIRKHKTKPELSFNLDLDIS